MNYKALQNRNDIIRKDQIGIKIHLDQLHALHVLEHLLWTPLLLHLPLLFNRMHRLVGISSLQVCWIGDSPHTQWVAGQYPAAQLVMHHSFIPG